MQPESSTTNPKQIDHSTLLPKVRLEDVVGKLLTSSTGKQSVVRVSHSDSPVRNAFLNKTSPTVTPAKPTSTQGIVSETITRVQPTPEVKKLSKKARIKLLEAKLETLEKRINAFAKYEVSLDEMDRDESAYIQEAKLKEEFVRTWRKYCKLTGDDPDAVVSTRKKVKVHSAPFPEINREVERYINRTNAFPNLFDIKSVCMQANNKHHLEIKSCDVHSISVDVFTEVGRKLQKNREKELRANSGNILTDLALQTPDPALEDENLKLKLKRNRKIAKKKTEDVFQDYVRQQYEQMGEGRNEGNESSADEEDDEMESLRRNNLIENKKVKQKLIKNKMKGGSSTATSSKKSKRTENTTVINVTLSSSKEEPSNKNNINCHVTFNASPKNPSVSPSAQISTKTPTTSDSLEEELRPTTVNAAKFKDALKNSGLSKPNKTPSKQATPNKTTYSSSPQTHKRVLADKLEDVPHPSHFPGFLSGKRPLESSIKLPDGSPLWSAHNRNNSSSSLTSYESPLKRFRSLPEQQPQSPSQLPSSATKLPVPAEETVKSKTKPVVNSYTHKKTEQDQPAIVLIDSDDD